MSILAIIPARGGSKGIPGKNLVPLRGKSLIVWTIEAAKEVIAIDRLIVSTDDERIAETAISAGAEVPFKRPVELSTDSATNLEVLMHASDWHESETGQPPRYLLLLQPTSPLRSSVDIRTTLEIAFAQNADAVVSVGPAATHPFLCRALAEDGKLKSFILPEYGIERRRQEWPPAYAINGAIYLIRRQILQEQKTLLPENTLGYLMPPERSIDVDDQSDLLLAEYYLSLQQRVMIKIASGSLRPGKLIVTADLQSVDLSACSLH